MTIDDKDLGCRPEHGALLELADRIDRERAELLKAWAPRLAAAGQAIKDGDNERAAVIYDELAQAFAAKSDTIEKERWQKRAVNCRKASTRRKRGRGRRR